MEPFVIIGNGPAGIACLRELSSRDPLVISPSKTPEPSVCGGVITGEGMEYLRQNHLLQDVLDHGAKLISRIDICRQGNVIARKEFNETSMIALKRDRFDRLLWNKIPTEPRHIEDYVRQIHFTQDCVKLSMRSGRLIETGGVIDASGHRQIAKQKANGSPGYVGREWHGGDGNSVDTLLMIPGKGFYAGIVSDGTSKLTISAVAVDHSLKTDEKKLWNNIYRHLPDPWKARLPEVPPSQTKSKGGFWNEPDTDHGNARMVPIGDALGFNSPLTGEGISMALREGQAVGQLLKARKNHHSSIFPLNKQAQRTVKEKALKPFLKNNTKRRLAHFLGSHGSWIEPPIRWIPGLGHFLLYGLIP